MFLQLHDGPGMASERYPRIPDLRLPDIALISNRQILFVALEEGGKYAADALKNYNKEKPKDDLPTIKKDNIKKLNDLVNDGTLAAPVGSVPVPWFVQLGIFIGKNWSKIQSLLEKFGRTVSLFQVNNRIKDYYNINQYSFRELNEMTPQQIDLQLQLISSDLLNATAEKREVEASALSRMSQVYQQRKAMLPFIDQRTMLLIGGGLLAYLMFRK